MPGYWILKTEPTTYSFDQLAKAGTAVWDGVANPVALRNIGNMRPGDQVLIYHTGKEKTVVGKAEATSAGYPDPKGNDPHMLVVNLKAGARLAKPVGLPAIKAEPAFADMALVRQGRLSVVSATKTQWDLLVKMGS
ncbi:MAG: EVE domain-containing protein [Gemmatimonadetes bacterium]|nr:EVE domain-containing protein [Gemmatimonadota bacterium]